MQFLPSKTPEKCPPIAVMKIFGPAGIMYNVVREANLACMMINCKTVPFLYH